MLNETEQKLIRLTATTARPGIQALIEGRQTAAHCRVILAHAALLSPAETARIQNLLADAEAITGGTDGSA